MPIVDGAKPISDGGFQDWIEKNPTQHCWPFEHVVVSRETLEDLLKEITLPDGTKLKAAGVLFYQTRFDIGNVRHTTLSYVGVDEHGNPMDGQGFAKYYSERPCPPYCDWKPA